MTSADHGWLTFSDVHLSIRMHMIDSILVPLDGSDLAEATLPYAQAVQRAFSSRLILLRVVGNGVGASDSVEWRLCQAEARAYLEGIVERLREDGIEVEAVVTAGKPSESILEIARDRKIDLVLLSTHGAGGPSRFEVSGTAHKVLSAGVTSVLLVRVAQGRGPAPGPTLRTILVPMDGSRRSEWAFCLATSLARAAGSELLLLRVLPRPEAMFPGAGEADTERVLEGSRKNAEDWMAGWVRQLGGSDIEVRSEVVVASSVPRAIDEVAVRENVSLTVLSAHGCSADNGEWPYGSVAGAVLHHGTTPVLVFQDAPPRTNEHDRERRHGWVRPRSNQVAWAR